MILKKNNLYQVYLISQIPKGYFLNKKIKRNNKIKTRKKIRNNNKKIRI